MIYLILRSGVNTRIQASDIWFSVLSPVLHCLLIIRGKCIYEVLYSVCVCVWEEVENLNTYAFFMVVGVECRALAM